MGLARQEAAKCNHQYIGTEHILLGLIQEGSGVAANVLRHLDVRADRVREEIFKVIQEGPTMAFLGQLPFTPRAKKMLELSTDAANALHHNYIGTEHLLLGLLRENEGVAAQVLMSMGLRADMVRDEILAVLGATNEPRDPSTPSPAVAERLAVAAGRLAVEAEQHFDRYQEFTRTTAVFPGAGQPGFNSVAYLTFGLTGEAGEVAEKLKKRYRLGGANSFLPGSVVVYEKTGEQETFEQFRENVKKELGDVMWYVAGLADAFGFKLSEVADGNVSKLSGRKADGTLKGKGDNR
jgi:NTP pyrophosphatase (non-canonical NTP hydrolase)